MTVKEAGTAEELVERWRADRVLSAEEIYAANGRPEKRIAEKHTDHLTPLIMEFVTRAPFFLMATSDAAGNCDVSPKGDGPGVVRVLDPRTLAIPDRPGNQRIDGHRNVLENPHVGLIFVVPGLDETLRINGRCFLSKDSDLLESLAHKGRAPVLATIVEIDQVFMHCARAFLRSGLWKPHSWPDPNSIPTLAAIMNEQKNLPAPDESQGKRQEEYRRSLW